MCLPSSLTELGRILVTRSLLLVSSSHVPNEKWNMITSDTSVKMQVKYKCAYASLFHCNWNWHKFTCLCMVINSLAIHSCHLCQLFVSFSFLFFSRISVDAKKWNNSICSLATRIQWRKSFRSPGRLPRERHSSLCPINLTWASGKENVNASQVTWSVRDHFKSINWQVYIRMILASRHTSFWNHFYLQHFMFTVTFDVEEWINNCTSLSLTHWLLSR